MRRRTNALLFTLALLLSTRALATDLRSYSFSVDVETNKSTPTKPALDGMTWECGAIGETICYSSCVDKAFYAHGKVFAYTCDGFDVGSMSYRCGCVISMPAPGPYQPPCYWNCSSGAGRSTGGLY